MAVLPAFGGENGINKALFFVKTIFIGTSLEKP